MKKILSILLVLTFASSLFTLAAPVEYGDELQNEPPKTYTQTFSDVPTNHWAFEYIAEMVDRGVLNGYPDKTFRPGNLVRRDEFAKIMVGAAGLEVKKSALSSFSDVTTSDWSHPFVETAKDYLTGYSAPDGKLLYKPSTPALREDIVVALVRLKGYDTSITDLSMLRAMFSDYDAISDVAKRYAAVGVERGLISGYSDGTFRPQNSITRAEAAALLWRAYQYGNDNKVIGGTPASGSDTKSIPEQTLAPETTLTTEQTPAPSAKPYQVNTVVKADVTNYKLYTSDNSGNLYYVEGSKIFKVNIASKSKEELLDVKSLEIDDEEKTLSDFKVSSLIYDTFGERLLVGGKYQKVNSVTWISGEYLFQVVKGTVSEVENEDYYSGLAGVLGNGDFLYGKRDALRDHEVLCAEITDNAVYFINASYFSPILYIYDYTQTERITLNIDSISRAGLKNQKLYVINNSTLTVFNYNGKKLSEIMPDNIQVKDATPLSLGDTLAKLIITENEDIVFYDKSAKAFRIISKNE